MNLKLFFNSEIKIYWLHINFRNFRKGCEESRIGLWQKKRSSFWRSYLEGQFLLLYFRSFIKKYLPFVKMYQALEVSRPKVSFTKYGVLDLSSIKRYILYRSKRLNTMHKCRIFCIVHDFVTLKNSISRGSLASNCRI